MIRRQLLLSPVVLLWGLLLHGWESPPLSHSDQRTGLIVQIPAGWTIDSDPHLQCLTIASFQSAKRPRMVLVPLDGAQIVVGVAPAEVTTIAEWLALDRVKPGPDVQIDSVELSIPLLGHVPATVVRENVRVIPEGRSLSVLLPLKKRLVKIDLFYRGQRRAAYFEAMQQALIQGLKPLQPR
jgi:hypothetical protein